MTATATPHGWPLNQPVTLDRHRATDAEPPATRESGDADERREALRRRLAETLHPVPPRRPPAVLDRERILAATAACFAEQGYDGTTIRRIARRLDCAVGSIYRYFSDKRALLTAVCERRFTVAVEAAEAGDLDASARAYLAAAHDWPEAYRLMFWLAALRPEARGAAMPAVVESLLAAWANRLPPHRDARTLWINLHGRAMLGIDAPTPVPTPEARPSTHPSDSMPDPADAPPASNDAPRAQASTRPETPRRHESDDLTLL